MTPRLRQALEDTGSKPNDPWWIIAEEMARVGTALSPDDVERIAQRCANACLSAASERHHMEYWKRLIVQVGWAAAVFIVGLGIGALT